MRQGKGRFLLVLIVLLVIALAGCAPAANPTQAPPAAATPTQVPPTTAPLATATAVLAAPTATTAPAAAATNPAPTQANQAPSTPQPSQAAATPGPEARQIELEYPASIKLGESDVIHLSLAPSQKGYVVQAEFPEHQTSQQEVPVQRPPGYDLYAVARLDGVAFDLTPQGDQVRSLPAGETITWSWSLTPRRAGQQRLALTLLLRWQPVPAASGSLREAVIFSRGLQVQVSSFLGLPPALAGLIGAGMAVLALLGLVIFLSLRLISGRRVRGLAHSAAPNPRLSLETTAGLRLSSESEALLRALFNAYARLLVTAEFLSGYSGARTFLTQPIRADGRSDAYTIVKIGERKSIEREFANYEAFVKDTLPPVTSRIQHAPVRLARGSQAALRYTFIGEAGQAPVSLRQALLENPDPGLLRQLYTTFGPYWWQQRRPYTFTLGAEYDGLLPAHLILVPEPGKGAVLDGSTHPDALHLAVGDRVTLRSFARTELRADGKSLSLIGQTQPGQPPLRVRWSSLENPEGASGRVTATRQSLLAERVSGMERFGLPDPLDRLAELLATPMHATQSIIHGDLNLENILIGPGRLVWLIDFAQTREGHTLLDFAHLEAEIIGQVMPAIYPAPAAYLDRLTCHQIPLLAELEAIASTCQFDPSSPREYRLALILACLGALKHDNISPSGRHLLFLSAAFHLSIL